jgi:hypothetical protein
MLTELLMRWTRRQNLRRVAEDALTVGFQLVGVWVLARLIGWEMLWMTPFVLALAAVRLRRRWSSVAEHARRVDVALSTHGLLETAMALEAGRGETKLSETVLQRAYKTVPNLNPRPIAPFIFPRGAGVLAGLAILVHQTPFAQLSAAIAATDDEVVAPEAPKPDPLPDEEREAIAKMRDEVKELSRIPHLTPEARERLLAAEAALDKVATGEAGGTDALSNLADAEELLEELSEDAEDDALYEKDALETATNEALAEALAEAMERGDTELAAELLEEASRRVAEAPGGAELGDLGDALEKASSGEEGDPLKEAGELLKEGKRTEGGKELAKTGKELKKGEGKDSGDRLGELGKKSKRARKSEMSRMMGEEGEEGGKKGREGKGGKPGEGGEPGEKVAKAEGRKLVAGIDDGPGGVESKGGIDLAGGATWDGESGNPSTAPGPGEVDSSGTDPATVKADSEWIETQWAGAPEKLLETVDGHARGEDGDARFVEVHDKYTNVAEAAGETQELPLTRRELARDYFEEIKP